MDPHPSQPVLTPPCIETIAVMILPPSRFPFRPHLHSPAFPHPVLQATRSSFPLILPALHCQPSSLHCQGPSILSIPLCTSPNRSAIDVSAYIGLPGLVSTA
eukprot:759904-Hanusia_phi.AAC.5